METHGQANAALAIATALAAGMIAQALARHLRLPGIVILLAFGVLLGPDVLHLLDPGALGHALHDLVGFAVAVILFEGGMNLDLKRLRREASVIRRLLTVGALITAVGSTLAAHWLMGWDWRLSAAFGSLVIVTGPTVITPLLRRIKVKPTVATVLEAEGVLIDAIGAVLAVVTLQVIIGSSITEGLISIPARLGFGAAFGLIGGALIALLLRVHHLVPEGLENVFTLSLVLVLFHVSNLILPESGIMTVTAAGMVVGNVESRVLRDLMEFKEQLTVMLIGMLFVLLAADVRISEVVALGWPAVLTVLVIMLVVRPINALLCSIGTSLSWRERAFLSWLAPRGVVAAAVATLFAQSFAAAGIPGGKELQALVFMVIAGTVVVQGLSGGLVAQALGLRQPVNLGYAILGANELGLIIGRLLRMAGNEVIFIDGNPTACSAAEADGFKVVYGNVLSERTLQRARVEYRTACLAVTANEEVNLLFARKAREEFTVSRVSIALRRDQRTINTQLVRSEGLTILFGAPRDLDLWSVRLRRGLTAIESWTYTKPRDTSDLKPASNFAFGFPRLLLLPLMLQRGTQTRPLTDEGGLKKGDRLYFAAFTEKLDEAHQWLKDYGWTHEETLDRKDPKVASTQRPAADVQLSHSEST